MTTSGRAVASRACRRRRWKNCAGRRAVHDADVVLRGELEKALETGARVLGAVALVAVREQQHEPGRLPPLRATGDDELVDDDLRAVHEVAELRLPEDERVGSGDRVAVLERERGILGERRVVDLEGRGRRGKVLERRERLSRPRVVEHRMTMREGAPLGVLPREADRDAFLEERAEGERLGVAPVDAALGERSPDGVRADGRAWDSPRSLPEHAGAARRARRGARRRRAVTTAAPVSVFVLGSERRRRLRRSSS